MTFFKTIVTEMQWKNLHLNSKPRPDLACGALDMVWRKSGKDSITCKFVIGEILK